MGAKSSQCCGAAIKCKDCSVENSVFSNNYAEDYGGAIYSYGTIEILYSNFTTNTADDNSGGAIHAEGAANIIGSYFADNVAHSEGGAIRAVNDMTIENSIFDNNSLLESSSQCCGAAIKSTKDFTVKNCSFLNHHAYDYGGAIYTEGNVRVLYSEFINNVVDDNDGGAIYSENDVTVIGSKFINNKALVSGGAISSGKEVNVKDSTFENNYASGAKSHQCCGAAIKSETDITVENTLFISNIADDYGGAIYAEKGTAKVTSCNFTDNAAQDNDGGAIYANAIIVKNSVFENNFASGSSTTQCYGGAICAISDVNVANSLFIKNTVEDYGGAIYSKGTVNISSSNFTTNTAKDNDGGAIYAVGNIIITGSSFTENNALVDGGAIYGESLVKIENSIFENNQVYGAKSSQCYGGAIKAKDVNINNASFLNNHAHDYGGAIYAEGEININNSNIIGSIVDDNKGGAIYCEGNVNIFNSKLSDNRALVDGGAVYADGAAKIFNSILENNQVWGAKSQCYGGAVRVLSAFVSNSTFLNNHAQDYGGAIYVGGEINIFGSNFTGNFVDDDNGGAVYAEGTATIVNSYFADNKVECSGGAVYGESNVILHNSTFVNNQAYGDDTDCLGGAIRSRNNVKVDNSTFVGNHAYDYGGAIYADTVTWVDSPSRFFDNYVEDNAGGAIYTNIFTNDVSLATFVNNAAKKSDDGGAIYINKENHLTFSACWFERNYAGDEGGAIYLDSTDSVLTLGPGNSFIDNHAGDEGHDVFNKGNYGAISGNWWGTDSPNFDNGQLIEWKSWPSDNVKHSDSNPLSVAPTQWDNCSSIVSNNLVKMFRNDTQFSILLLDSEKNILPNTTVKFSLNGRDYIRTTDENGMATLNINLGPGLYNIAIFNPVTFDLTHNYINVVPLEESNDLVKYYKNGSQFVVLIHSADGSAVGAGENVTFNINGVFYTRTTNATGHVSLNINLPEGNYIITTSYKGCNVANNIEVLSLLSANDIKMRYMDGSQFIAKLVDGQGYACPNQYVTFNINGVLYNRITDNNGLVKLNIRLIPGEYIITSSFNGCNIANRVTVTF